MALRLVTVVGAASPLCRRLRQISRTPLARLVIVYRLQRHRVPCPSASSVGGALCNHHESVTARHSAARDERIRQARLLSLSEALKIERLPAGGTTGDFLVLSSPRAAVDLCAAGTGLDVIC